MAEDKKRRRICTRVVVRPPKTAPLPDADYELAVNAIATMIARWWDANGRQTADPDDSAQNTEHPESGS